MTIETNSPEETFALGQKLGEQAKAGQIYTLNGDLGVGKTVFTQGIARGLGITVSCGGAVIPKLDFQFFCQFCGCPGEGEIGHYHGLITVIKVCTGIGFLYSFVSYRI